jgi:hypothetical protein
MSEEELLRELDEKLRQLSVEGSGPRHPTRTWLATARILTRRFCLMFGSGKIFTMRSGQSETCTVSMARRRGGCCDLSIRRIRDDRIDDNAPRPTPCL